MSANKFNLFILFFQLARTIGGNSKLELSIYKRKDRKYLDLQCKY